MRAKTFCRGCKIQLLKIPFVGDKIYEFEDGVYCEKCAQLLVKKRRTDFDGS